MSTETLIMNTGPFMRRRIARDPDMYQFNLSEDGKLLRKREVKVKHVMNGLSEHTTAHVIPHVKNAKGQMKRSCYTVTGVIASIGLLANLVIIFRDFFAYRVSVSMVISPEKSLVFPAVTMCNTNPVVKSQLRASDDTSLIDNISKKRRRKKRSLLFPCSSADQIDVSSGLCFGLHSTDTVRPGKADSVCASKGGTAALPASQMIVDYLQSSSIFNGIDSSYSYWINMRRGEWNRQVDVNGFTYYADGYPVSSEGNCISASLDNFHKWSNVHCNKQKYRSLALCQKLVQCPFPLYENTATGEKHCYFTVGYSQTASYGGDDSSILCDSYTPDAKLAVIDTQDKLNHIKTHLSALFNQLSMDSYWIDLHRDGNWIWNEPDVALSLWTNWVPGYNSLSHKCATGNSAQAHVWTPTDCSELHIPLCEYAETDLTYVPYWTVSPESTAETTEPDTTTTTTVQTTQEPTTTVQTTQEPTTTVKTTQEPTTTVQTTQEPTTTVKTTQEPTTTVKTTQEPTTTVQTTQEQTTTVHTTQQPTTTVKTTQKPTTTVQTTQEQTTTVHTTQEPTTTVQTTQEPTTTVKTTQKPTTTVQTTQEQTTTVHTTQEPTTTVQTTQKPTTTVQNTQKPTTAVQTTQEPTTTVQTTQEPSTTVQTTQKPTTTVQTTQEPTTTVQTTQEPTTTVQTTQELVPTSQAATTTVQTTQEPPTTVQTTQKPTTTLTSQESQEPTNTVETTLEPTTALTSQESQEPTNTVETTLEPTTALTSQEPTTVQTTQEPTMTVQTTQEPTTTVQTKLENTTTIKIPQEPTTTDLTTTTEEQTSPSTISTTTTISPVSPTNPSLEGSIYPERVQPNEEFAEEEKMTETLAALPEDTKVSLGYTVDAFLLDCQYAGYGCSQAEYFSSFYNPIHGNCFTFNSGWNETKLERSVNTGRRYGLKVVLNINQDEYISGSGEEAGSRIVVHDQDNMAFPEDEGLLVKTGQLTSIEVSKLQVSRQPHPYSTCVDASKPAHDRDVFQEKFPVSYSQAGCLKTCYQAYVVRECDCSDANYPDYGKAFEYRDVSPCRSDNIIQDDCKYGVSQRYLKNELVCDCPKACKDTVFFTSRSESMWPSDRYIHVTQRKYGQLAPNLLTNGSADKYRNNLIKIEVYYKDFNVKYIKESPAIPIGRFLSDVGGVLGLYLGFSLLTIFEFVEFAIDLIALFYYRIRNKPRLEQTTATPTTATERNDTPDSGVADMTSRPFSASSTIAPEFMHSDTTYKDMPDINHYRRDSFIESQLSVGHISFGLHSMDSMFYSPVTRRNELSSATSRTTILSSQSTGSQPEENLPEVYG